jgi:hypothetical protein
MASSREEEDIAFSSDFDEEYDYPDTFAPHSLNRNFHRVSQSIWSGESDVSDHDNDDSSVPSTSASTATTTTTRIPTAATSSASTSRPARAAAADSSDSDENEPGDFFADPTEHLRFIFEEIDAERLPKFNWLSAEKIACIPPFIPDKPFGPTRAMPANSKPIDYFNIFYDDAMLQKVSIQ